MARYTPMQIIVLLHCYAIAEPLMQVPAAQEAAGILTKLCLIEPYGDKPHMYRTTEKGGAWAKMILSTPLPERKWIDPREEPDGK